MSVFGDFIRTIEKPLGIQTYHTGNDPFGASQYTTAKIANADNRMVPSGPQGGSWSPQQQAAPQADTGGDGGYGGGYSYAPAYDPNTDPGKVAATRADVFAQRGGLDNLYNALFGDIGNMAQERRNNIDTQAVNDRSNMEKQYTKGVNQIGAAYGSRGAFDSSYRGNEQQGATDAYNTGLQDYNKNLQNSYADLGKWIDTTRSQYQTQHDQANQLFDAANQAQDVNSLNSIKQNVLGLLSGLNNARAGLKTNPQYVASLNAIAPDATGVAKALSGKLQNLVTSSAPIEAKAAIAQGYINSSNLQDQNAKDYWQNYFNQLIRGGDQNSTTATNPTVLPTQKPLGV